MQPVEYQQLRAYEEWYWWYAAQRMNLLNAVRDLNLPRGAQVLDAGCGSGATLDALTRELGLCGHGVDVSEHAAALWNGIGGAMRCRASVNALPYADRVFDAVCSVDVLGCRGVERKSAVCEMNRVLRPGGFLVLLAPAYQWMLSEHDAAVHSVHRFTRKELSESARRAGFDVVRVTHRFPLFFPLIAVVRMSRKGELALQVRTLTPAAIPGIERGLNEHLSHERSAFSARSDLRPIPRWLNGLLWGVAKVEHALVRGINVPFGSTILLVARKVGP